MSIINKNLIINRKVSFLVLAVAAVFLTGLLAYLVQSNNNKHYSCIYRPDMIDARCDLISETSCLGHFPLKGKDIKEGIVVKNSDLDNTTCEGLSAPERYYFSKSGKFIEVKPFSEGIFNPDI